MNKSYDKNLNDQQNKKYTPNATPSNKPTEQKMGQRNDHTNANQKATLDPNNRTSMQSRSKDQEHSTNPYQKAQGKEAFNKSKKGY